MTSAAETPRDLDVRTFAQARETELRYLLQAVKHDVGEGRFGAPFLPRHLRRRATSHRRFSVRCRPNLRLAALYGSHTSIGGGGVDRSQSGQADRVGPGDGARSRWRRVSPSSAVGGLSTAVPAAAAASPSTAVATSGVTAPPGPASGPGPQPQPQPSLRPTNRRMRRRPAMLQAAAEASCARDLAPPQTPTGPPTPAQVRRQMEAEAEAEQGCLRRLETHVWVARRMAMEQRWGHAIASHAPGRGRGSRSLLAQLQRGSLLHDSSYIGCVELRGHQRDLADLLRRLSDPARLDELLDRPEVISGAAEWSLFLHRPGAFPRQPLAPARALWLTPPDGDEPQHAGDEQAAAAGAAVDAEGWATRCVLWLWVHAAAFRDVWEALHMAAAAVVSEPPPTAAGTTGPRAVTIHSRCSDLRRIDVVGAAADAAVARVLRPLATPSPSPSPPQAAAPAGGAVRSRSSAVRLSGSESGECGGNKGDSELGGSLWCGVWRREAAAAGDGGGGGDGGNGGTGPRWRWRWPSGAVLGMVVADPRLAAPVRVGGAALRVDALVEAAAEVGAYHASGGDGCGGGSGPRDVRCLGEVELWRQLRQWPEAGDWTLGGAALWRDAVAGAVAPAPTSNPTPAQTPTPGGGDLTVPPASMFPVPPLDQSRVAAIRQAARKRLLRAGLEPGGGIGVGPAAAVERGGGDGGGGNGSSGGSAVSFPMLLIRRPEGDSPWGPRARANGKTRTRTRARSGQEPAAAGAATGGGWVPGPGAGAGHGPGGGWSVVLPARWVMPLWASLAFAGARPTGQSEWRQLATHFRTPCFPYDHPYTPAGARYNVEAAAELAAAASRRPLGRARRPPDLGPVADWTRLMQPPTLPVRHLPVALLGGSGPPAVCRPRQAPPSQKEEEAAAVAPKDAGGDDKMEEDAAAAPAATPAVVGAAKGRAPHVPGAQPGSGCGVVSGYGDGGSGGAAAAVEGAVEVVTAAHPEGTSGQTSWALALSAATLRAVLQPKAHKEVPLGPRAATAANAPEEAARPDMQPTHAQHKQKQQKDGSKAPPVQGGRQPASKDHLHGWSLRRALRLGLVSTPAAAPGPAAAATPPSQQERRENRQQEGAEGRVAAPRRAEVGDGAEAKGPSGCLSCRGRCLVCVALRVEGRGGCEAGAEVIGPVAGSNADWSGGCSRAATSATCTGAGAEAREGGQLADAVMAEGEAAEAAEPGGGVSGGPVVLGYVVSAATRGSPAYPGGIALCDAAGLASLVAAPGSRRGAGSQSGSGGAAAAAAAVGAQWPGAGAAGLGLWGRGGNVLRLWVRNPGSEALRACRAEVLLLGDGPAGGAGVGAGGDVARGGGPQLAWN